MGKLIMEKKGMKTWLDLAEEYQCNHSLLIILPQLLGKANVYLSKAKKQLRL